MTTQIAEMKKAVAEMKKAVAGFACMECGHKFRTVKAAERAAFGDSGCPKCGGSDIDLRASK